MNQELVEILLIAWRAWDEHPGNPERANAMEDACQALAANIGIPATVLRSYLAAHYRTSHSRREALRSLE